MKDGVMDLKELSEWSSRLPMCRKCMLEDMENGTDIAALLQRLTASIPTNERSDVEEILFCSAPCVKKARRLPGHSGQVARLLTRLLFVPACFS